MPRVPLSSKSRRELEHRIRTPDVWLCQCVRCGTNNPVRPSFRASRNYTELLTISAANTAIPSTCSGCGLALELLEVEGLATKESIGERRERRHVVKQKMRAERKARAERQGGAT